MYNEGFADCSVAVSVWKRKLSQALKAPSGRELAPQATEGERVQPCAVAVNVRDGESYRRLLPSFSYENATSLSEGG